MIPTALDIANDIRMARTQHSGSFLIVEGKTADLRVYKRFFDSDVCQVIPAHSKDNALGAIELLEKDGFAGVVAIVDADFWRLEGKEVASRNVVVTDSHDLETMIINSPALDKILVEFCSPDKIDNLVKKRKKSIREILLDLGRPIGYLRWVSVQNNLSLKIKEIPFKRFIDKKKKFSLDTGSLIKTVKNKSGKHNIPDHELLRMIDEVADPAHDAWDVCCGHDLVCILSIGLGRALGSNKSNDVRPEHLEKILRVAYESTYFFATDLYQSLKVWEVANQPFRIFPTD